MDTKIVCRLAETEEDRSAAISFITKWFWNRNQWITPPSGGDILIACEKDKIVGAVNLDFRDNNTPFPLEEWYTLSDITTHFPFFDRKYFVQGGRWSALRPDVSRMLLTAIAVHCTPRGVLYMIGEVKQYSAERLEKLGIQFLLLYGVVPHFESLPIKRQKYYLDPPLPRLMVIQIKHLF